MRLRRLEELRELVNSVENRTNDRLNAQENRLAQVDMDLVEISKSIAENQEGIVKANDDIDYAIGLAETCDTAIKSLNEENDRFLQQLNRDKQALSSMVQRRMASQAGGRPGMPSPHDVERRRIQKERQKANKKAANEKKEEEWLRFRALESMREAMSLQRAEAQIQAEAKARQERERTEREKFEREFREEERRRELK
ncbi:hypothetical protein QAD02_003350 [Eretmocerus hayati]|uniref:Uncharacterized protein n=1 Tax=Eretmocerus hayati TaxID=131215 RepID=A0ACC2NMF5_9HYME|nr:hypothetical protein QAD02_003350 [Eretmocerus hayati]